MRLQDVSSPPSSSKSGNVTSRKPKGWTYADVRPREHLTEKEIERLIAAAKKGRWGHRDSTLITMMFTHGLRASEAVLLEWDHVQLDGLPLLTVHRKKGGQKSEQPIPPTEQRALRKLRRDHPDAQRVFVSERGGRMSTSNIRKLMAKLGEVAKIPFPIHPHMLRHSCGYKLVNSDRSIRKIQLYLGHRNIRHTEAYTQLSPNAFKGWFTE